jgi:predicted nuclease of restriction endonuclease-like (RecB) superfamily
MYTELLNVYSKNGYIYEYWKKENANAELEYQHRRIWIQNIGDIPKGYEIHHINSNKKDNSIGEIFYIYLMGKMAIISGNLLCLPAEIHSKLFHSIEFKKEI